MKKLKSLIRAKLRSFLGVDDLYFDLTQTKNTFSRLERAWEQATTEIQDVSIKGNTRIVVASNIGCGFVKWYDLKFSSHSELLHFCQMVAEKEISSKDPIIDAPRDYYPMIDDGRRSLGLPKRSR